MKKYTVRSRKYNPFKLIERWYYNLGLKYKTIILLGLAMAIVISIIQSISIFDSYKANKNKEFRRINQLVESYAISIAPPLSREKMHITYEILKPLLNDPAIDAYIIMDSYGNSLQKSTNFDQFQNAPFIEKNIYILQLKQLLTIGKLKIFYNENTLKADLLYMIQRSITEGFILLFMTLYTIYLILNLMFYHLKHIISKGTANSQSTLPFLLNSSELKQFSSAFTSLSKKLSLTQHESEEVQKTLTEEIRRQTDALLIAKKEAEQANSAKSEFLSNISHELRTPIHSILSFTNILKDTFYKKEKEYTEELLSLIQNCGKELLYLVDNLLDLTKLETNSLELHMDKHDVYDLVNRVHKELSGIALEKQITISLQSAINNTETYCDEYKITQVIRNLTANAIKYSPNKTDVAIAISLMKLSPEDVLFHNVKQGHKILKDDLEFLVTTQFPAILGIIRANRKGGIDPFDSSSIEMLFNWLGIIYRDFLLANSHYHCLRFYNFENIDNSIVIARDNTNVVSINNNSDWYNEVHYKPFIHKAEASDKLENFFSNIIKIDENTHYISGLMVLCDAKTKKAHSLIELGWNEDFLPDTDVEMIAVSVKDQGIGIPESELENIFDKFIQSSRTNTGAGGSGLGLTICDKIVKAHRGKIWAENNTDKGANFTFVIPHIV